MNKKPDFLDTPGAWTRTARQSQTPAEYGCAIEGPTNRQVEGWGRVGMYVLVCIALALLLVGLI